jgi:hypothetical protein
VTVKVTRFPESKRVGEIERDVSVAEYQRAEGVIEIVEEWPSASVLSGHGYNLVFPTTTS